MYVFDYGAPIGFRIALKHPERILGIISQNGNVYEEGLGKKWEARAEYWKNPTEELRRSYQTAFAKDTVIGQYTYGTGEGSVSPDGYSLDLYYSSVIPDYAEKQSELIFDYQNNVRLYPEFQTYLRSYKPRLLAVWGKMIPPLFSAGSLPVFISSLFINRSYCLHLFVSQLKSKDIIIFCNMLRIGRTRDCDITILNLPSENNLSGSNVVIIG